MAIRINKELEFFSTFDPTKESKPISIGNLCKEIQENKISIPIFQTYIRWSLEKCVELLNFQLYGKAAVSPISINVIENEELAVTQLSFIDRKKIENIKGINSVNDGQQRLSCNYKAYTNHDDFRCIVLDISKGKFIINNTKISSSQIPVGKLYNGNPNEFKKYLSEHKPLQSFEVQNLLTEIRNKHLGYYYTVNYAKDLEEKEQREWFEVLNLAGSRVSEVQVDLTNMLIKGVDFYKEYSDLFFERMSESNLEELFGKKSTEISIPVAALNSAFEVLTNKKHTLNFSPIPSDKKATQISKLEPKIIRNIFELTLENLDKSINFIEQNNLKTPDRIDYITYLAGAFVYIGDKQLNSKQNEFLINWYNSVNFSKKDNGVRREIFNDLIKDVL